MSVKNEMPRDIKTYSYEALAARLKPITANAPEANIDTLYDEQTYVAAGQARLNFFVNVPAGGDATLSNMELAGQLPANTFFDVFRIFCDAQRIPTATAAETAAGVVNDLATILHIARGTFTFKQQSKALGPIPMTFLGRSGGVAAAFGTGRAAAGGAIIQHGTMPDNGGWPVNGTIKLGPGSKFGLTLDFVAGTAIAVDTPLRISFLGVGYRPVS